MSVQLITYDLNNPGQNYDKVLKKIKDYDAWARLSESSYAVETNQSPSQIHNNFKPVLDANDTFYVIGLHSPYSGYGPEKVNDWLANRLKQCVPAHA